MEYLNQLLMFFGLVFALIIIWSLIVFKGNVKKMFEYFKTNLGLGAVKSALLAIFSIAVISLAIYLMPNNAHAQGSWFNDAGVYMGLDYTKKPSPQCVEDSVDNRGTSNLGFKANIWQSESKLIRVNSKYTHHSCFIGKDRNGYDGFGVEVEWKLWSKK